MRWAEGTAGRERAGGFRYAAPTLRLRLRVVARASGLPRGRRETSVVGVARSGNRATTAAQLRVKRQAGGPHQCAFERTASEWCKSTPE
jgi:hypothetical protein